MCVLNQRQHFSPSQGSSSLSSGKRISSPTDAESSLFDYCATETISSSGLPADWQFTPAVTQKYVHSLEQSCCNESHYEILKVIFKIYEMLPKAPLTDILPSPNLWVVGRL